MNGVRRFLNGGGGSAAQDPTPSSPPKSPPRLGVPPLTIPLGGPSWPPSSPGDTMPQSPPMEPAKTTTAALFFRKDKQKPVPAPSSTDEGSVPPSTSAQSPPRPANGRSNSLSTKSPESPSTSRLVRKQALPNLNGTVKSARDDLLITLLSSEALVESREYEVLTAEEVEELKKEQEVLSAKLVGLSKKLQLEQKIRDAALSLSKANASYKQMSKQTNEQLAAAERKVDLAQKEVWRVSERSSEIDRRLLQHRAAVLSLSVRSMEDKINPTQANGRPDSAASRNLSLSPNSPANALSPATGRFDGPHFFAGHASALSPQAGRPPASPLDIAALEEKLKAATDALGAASKKQAEMTRELSMLRLEKEEVQTTMEIDLQSAQDTISNLEAEIGELKAGASEVDVAQQEALRMEMETKLAEKDTEVRSLQKRVQDAAAASASHGEASALLVQAQEEHAKALVDRDAEKKELESALEMEKLSWARLKSNLEAEHSSRMKALKLELQEVLAQRESTSGALGTQLEEATTALRQLLQTNSVILATPDPSIIGLVAALGTHVAGLNARVDTHARETEAWEVARRKLQDDVQLGLDKRQELVREVEEARREREDARRELRGLEQRLKDRPLSPTTTLRSDTEYSEDVSKVVAALEPIWAILPSPEARASRLSRTNGKSDSISSVGSLANSPKTGTASLSEMDVRALKTLYDPNGGMLRSPMPSEPFSISSFIARVQALVADDRALIERLIRFAQAHDLLKKNAERAQKLAQESNVALETYSKQVKTLEDRNMSMMEKMASVEEEIQLHVQTIERITSEKRELEASAAEQAETCRQLQEANDTLSARTLTLAEEAASSADKTRKQLEAQLAECQKSLEQAQEEIANLSTRNFTMMERQAELEEQLQKRR